jgi:hypothetical protein
MHRLLLVVALLIPFASGTPAMACIKGASPEAIDDALAASEKRLSAAEIVKVKELRQQTSQFLRNGNYLEAKSAGSQAMAIMGMTFMRKGPPSRGCGSGEWVRKDQTSNE